MVTDCKKLLPSAHELFNNTDVKEGSTVGAACDNGYSMFGVPFITCLPGGIWDEDTSRECRKGEKPNNDSPCRLKMKSNLTIKCMSPTKSFNP